MMTVREKLRKMLTDGGMSEDEADEATIAAIAKIERAMLNHEIAWDGPAETYHDTVYSAMRLFPCD